MDEADEKPNGAWRTAMQEEMVKQEDHAQRSLVFRREEKRCDREWRLRQFGNFLLDRFTPDRGCDQRVA